MSTFQPCIFSLQSVSSPKQVLGEPTSWFQGRSTQSRTSRRGEAPLSPPLSPQKDESTPNVGKFTLSGRRQGTVDQISGRRLDRHLLGQDFSGGRKASSLLLASWPRTANPLSQQRVKLCVNPEIWSSSLQSTSVSMSGPDEHFSRGLSWQVPPLPPAGTEYQQRLTPPPSKKDPPPAPDCIRAGAPSETRLSPHLGPSDLAGS